jgi:ribosomal protein S18 acetylase RimI-like enzyme
VAEYAARYVTPDGVKIEVRNYAAFESQPPPREIFAQQQSIGQAALAGAEWVENAVRAWAARPARSEQSVDLPAAITAAVARGFSVTSPASKQRYHRLHEARSKNDMAGLWLAASAPRGGFGPDMDRHQAPIQAFLETQTSVVDSTPSRPWTIRRLSGSPTTTDVLGLYTAPEFQQKGIASALLCTLARSLPPESLVRFGVPADSVPDEWAKKRHLSPVEVIDDIGMIGRHVSKRVYTVPAEDLASFFRLTPVGGGAQLLESLLPDSDDDYLDND